VRKALGHGLVEMGKWKMRSLGGQQGFKVQMGVLKFVVFAPGGRFVANCMLLPKRLTFGQMLPPSKGPGPVPGIRIWIPPGISIILHSSGTLALWRIFHTSAAYFWGPLKTQNEVAALGFPKTPLHANPT